MGVPPITGTEPKKRRLPAPRPLLRFWPRVRPFLGTLILAVVALLLSSGIALAFPQVVRFLLDAAFVRRDRHLLDQIALLLLGLFTVQAFLNYLQTYLLTATGERAVAGLRQELFGKLLEMPPGFFAERRTGELTSRLTTDIGLLQGVLSHQIADFARQIISLLGGVVLLTLLAPRLTFTALGVVPVVIGTVVFFGRRLRQITTGVQDQVAEATAVAEEAFSQIRTVQSFVQEPAERARYGNRIGKIIETALHRARVRGVFFGAITFATFSGIVVVLWQGGLLVLSGQLTAGALVSFLLYTVTIAASIGGLTAFFSSYQEAIGAAQRVFELLETPVVIASPAIPLPLRTPVRGSIEFRDVSFRYRDDSTPILDQVSFHIAPGEVVALVGPSGAGKTTIASLLTRFWDPTEGTIELDGVELRRLDLKALRGVIGVVPQDTALFSGTVRENIGYARPDALAADIESAAAAAHATEFIDQLPQRYDSVVGERGVKLSGGQRQRIAIARAILKDPTVLILDEATSNLDSESEKLVEDALSRLLTGRTTLIIAHRLSTVRRADRLLVLEKGKIVEEGPHTELIARGGLYARLYQQQFREGDFVEESIS